MDRHTAENLANLLNIATEAWDVKNKVLACVHDNATNVVLANTELHDWESSPGFAHTSQLAINDGFKVGSINRVISGASHLVLHFHHSTVASKALQEKQQNLPEHHFVQYCRTRWNSIGDMFESLQEQKWTISAVLSDRNFTKLADARTLELTDGN